MNDARRKELDRAAALIAEAQEIISAAKDDEAAALENLPDSFKEGDQGTKMQECIDAMDEIDDSLQETIDKIDEAKGGT